MDFSNNDGELENFLANNESELKLNEIITFTFDNCWLSEASMISINRTSEYIEYDISITFWHSKWNSSKPLHRFILDFLQKAAASDLKLELELEDWQGYYLVAFIKSKPTKTMKLKLEEINVKLAEIVTSCL